MKKTLTTAILISCSVSWSASYSGPGVKTTAVENQKKYALYCKGTASSSATPAVNYENDKVKKAAKILSTISNYSFYYYSGPLKAYGLTSAKPDVNSQPVAAPAEANAPEGTSHNAHNFLTILCGEFRDRSTMIEAKIDWILKLYKLPIAKQETKIDMSKNIWSQVSAHSYGPYIRFSQTLWTSRKQKSGGTFDLGGYSVDIPVEGQLVCETKYIFDRYITQNKVFDDLTNFDEGYKEFAATEGNCSDSDKDSYYDFRGDSNFKPNSPESNGMIWYSSSIANQCKTTTTTKENAKIKAADCAAYFKAPFTARWNAARAGLSTWLFRDTKFDDVFAQEGAAVYILPHKEGAKKPFTFKIDGAEHNEFMSGWSQPSAWTKSDIGYNGLFSLGTSKADFKLSYERIRDAVNRHTDWYSSGFDDGMGMVRDQAYSPFVASSYDMSASDGFTSPGATVNSPSDGRKHWMFVFRVKKQNWYNTKSLESNVKIDFDKHWFDETSFGTNHLADSERAWDRLGTPLEDELDSIVYLHNIPSSGGTPEEDGYANPNGL